MKEDRIKNILITICLLLNLIWAFIITLNNIDTDKEIKDLKNKIELIQTKLNGN